jgi:hypothetical protein
MNLENCFGCGAPDSVLVYGQLCADCEKELAQKGDDDNESIRHKK